MLWLLTASCLLKLPAWLRSPPLMRCVSCRAGTLGLSQSVLLWFLWTIKWLNSRLLSFLRCCTPVMSALWARRILSVNLSQVHIKICFSALTLHYSNIRNLNSLLIIGKFCKCRYSLYSCYVNCDISRTCVLNHITSCVKSFSWIKLYYIVLQFGTWSVGKNARCCILSSQVEAYINNRFFSLFFYD